MKKQYFITLEGVEGVGKTTALTYIQAFLTENKVDFIQTREPGGTHLAEKIRDIVLTPSNEKLNDDAELLLMFAARAQHISEVIKPALQKGNWVICDRFTDATYAYQGAGRGIADQRIEILENWVHQDLQPDLTILLETPLEVSIARTQNRGALDRIEQEKADFFARVKNKYLERAQAHPERFRCINTNQPREAVEKLLADLLTPLVQK